MSDKDIISHNYMADNSHFADAFNYYVYGGKQIIDPRNLHDEDVTETAVVNKSKGVLTSKKTRDLFKSLTVKRDDRARYVLLGIENQSQIHYAMPVRNQLYDALNYWSQVSEEGKRLRKSKAKLSAEEILSGFSKESKLIPVITLVINWSSEKWLAPRKLSDMINIEDREIKSFMNDYEIRLIDPYEIDDFGKFHTMLGEVLEFIKNQVDEEYLTNKIKQNKTWMLDVESVNAINTFTGAKISIDEAKEGMIDMCRATEALREEGRKEGREEGRKEGKKEGRKEGKEEGRKEGKEEGRKEGKAEGIQEGTNQVNKLNSILIDEGRYDDLKRATNDPEYQKKLIKELVMS